MCGRYRLSRRKEVLDQYFDMHSGDEQWEPRYNIAPTQSVPVVRQNGEDSSRELCVLKWGLVPSWATDPSVGASMINARSETAATKPAFRDALRLRRCLIPTDGFYEWKRMGKARQPYCFEVNGGELFAFAGIWDCWRDRNGTAMETCSILTTTANSVTRIVHDRMPVILNPDSYDLWLDPGMKDVSEVSELLRPYDARLMRCYPVSSRINSAVNDDEECSRRVEPAVVQHHLFS
jgi:putative SOS response-associated peptidase YedK